MGVSILVVSFSLLLSYLILKNIMCNNIKWS